MGVRTADNRTAVRSPTAGTLPDIRVSYRPPPMGASLQGKVAIVTGAGRGIGRGEALTLAAEGASVVVNDVDAAAAAAVVDEIVGGSGSAVANTDDVASFDGAAALIAAAVDGFGRLDVVVNNAGFLRDRMSFSM